MDLDCDLGQTVSQGVVDLSAGAPCIENRGIEDNFIFHIECSYFFILVMKHKCEFNISKQFQSIVCLIFDLRYILTKNTW